MKSSAPILARLYLAIALAYVFAPLFSLALFSFQTGRVQALPIEGFTLDWYRVAFADQSYREGIWTSLVVALAVASISTGLGLASAHLLARRPPRWPLAYAAFVSLPAFVPLVLSGLVMLIYFQKIGIQGSIAGVIAAQVCYCSPFAFVVLNLSYQRLNVELEHAARNLGASELQILLQVVLPQLRHALLAALLLTALVSWDEFVLAFFVGGFTKTLPTVIYGALGTSFDPSVNAIGVSVTACSAVLLSLAARALRHSRSKDRPA